MSRHVVVTVTVALVAVVFERIFLTSYPASCPIQRRAPDFPIRKTVRDRCSCCGSQRWATLGSWS